MKIKKNCFICNREFEVYPSKKNQNLCSRKCHAKRIKGKNNPHWKKPIDKICLNCNKKYSIVPALEKRGNAKFCSKNCLFKYKTKKAITQKKCLICGKQFRISKRSIKKGWGKVCSHKCKTKWQIGKNASNWKGGKIENICQICGEKFYVVPSRIKQGNGKICSIICKNKYYSERFSGENSPHWRGGKSFEPYGLEFNKGLKKQIRKRDNYTCQECSYNQEQLGYKLHIHHIDYDKKNNSFNNLISLCRVCHTQTNFSREDWTRYFQCK